MHLVKNSHHYASHGS